MVRVVLELSQREIVMLLNCIDAALDTQHMQEQNVERVKDIRKQFSKYL